MENPFKNLRYQPSNPPSFHDLRRVLPEPVVEDEEIVHAYWMAWRMVERCIRWPMPGSPFVSNYHDEAFNDQLFLWDTCFITMYAVYGHGHVPGIHSLDNFYAIQMANGEIPRAVFQNDGTPHKLSQPGTPSSLNHPLLAWAELETYAFSGDKARLSEVYGPLKGYYDAFEQIRDERTGLYRADWAAMDNSPRNKNLGAAIDTSSEMVLLARQLARIGAILEKPAEATDYRGRADALAAIINEKMWDEDSGFYYDLDQEGGRMRVKTIAAYWTLLAEVAPPGRAGRLIAWLDDEATFKRPHRVPTLAADEPGYFGNGHYWCGGVWAPTNTMVIKGLECYHRYDLAREIALNHLENVLAVFKETHAIWEMYGADSVAPGETGGEPGHRVQPGFTGWSAMAPIRYLIEYKIGISVDAPANTLRWRLRGSEKLGLRQLSFANTRTDLLAQPVEGGWRIEVESDHPYRLEVHCEGSVRSFEVASGHNTFTL